MIGLVHDGFRLVHRVLNCNASLPSPTVYQFVRSNSYVSHAMWLLQFVARKLQQQDTPGVY